MDTYKMGQSLPTHREAVENAFKNNAQVRFYSKEQPNKLLILTIKDIKDIKRKSAKVQIYSGYYKGKEVISSRYILITYTSSVADLYEQLEYCLSHEYDVDTLLVDPLTLLYILLNKTDAQRTFISGWIRMIIETARNNINSQDKIANTILKEWVCRDILDINTIYEYLKDAKEIEKLLDLYSSINE